MKWYDFVLIAILSVMIWPFAMMILMANFNGILPLWVFYEFWNMYCDWRVRNG
jgi:hypothetical protein